MSKSNTDADEMVSSDAEDSFADGISRRKALKTSAVAGGAAATAGCLGANSGGDRAPTVYVTNNSERTISVIDAAADEVIDTLFIDAATSFPANQHGTGADSEYDVLWFNVSGGVEAYDPETLEMIAEVETGFGPNYQNVTPDGEHLVIASGGTTQLNPNPDNPEDMVYTRVDANPDSDTFGEVTGEISTGYVGPCDMTMGPDSEYAFAVDVAGEALRVLNVDPFETVAEVDVGESLVDGDVLPFMCTASFDGEVLFVENGEGQLGPEGERVGSESIWDISDPENPTELAKLGAEDGLSGSPITSEISPDNEAAYLFTPGQGVVVVDIAEQTIEKELDIGGTAISGTWGPNREKLYVPVGDANQVAVIDHEQRAVTTTIDVGEGPTGATSGMVRPNDDAAASILGTFASLGLRVGEFPTTFCPDGYCYCGKP
ncbi:MAG: hypothetical protein A07HR60_01996 [uncultured archaeon A07HR60]|nr:MAG: hypothetical protein A07HR60_01996 [uncultured archaeon A07HR60]